MVYMSKLIFYTSSFCTLHFFDTIYIFMNFVCNVFIGKQSLVYNFIDCDIKNVFEFSVFFQYQTKIKKYKYDSTPVRACFVLLRGRPKGQHIGQRFHSMRFCLPHHLKTSSTCCQKVENLV